jgi:hypothetical protein
MKSDEDVRMISAEAPVLFAKVRVLFLTCPGVQAQWQAESCCVHSQRSTRAAPLRAPWSFHPVLLVCP